VAQELYPQDPYLDGEVHFLEEPDSFVKRVLCYPRTSCADFDEKLDALLEDGFTYLLEVGKDVLGIRVLGKGYSAIVVAAHHVARGIGALKVLRVDSRSNSLLREAEMARRALPSGLPPRVYLGRHFYVFYELLPPHICKPLTLVIEGLLTRGDVHTLTSLLRNALTSLYALDLLRVDHTEINRPYGHVFYCNGVVKVIDWESARVSSKPNNLTSFVSYLLFRSRHADKLRYTLGYSVGRVLSSLRAYKAAYSLEAFSEVLGSLIPAS